MEYEFKSLYEESCDDTFFSDWEEVEEDERIHLAEEWDRELELLEFNGMLMD